MTYSIFTPNLIDEICNGKYRNLTFEAFISENKNLTDEEIWEEEYSFMPMVLHLHILQSKATEDDVKELLKSASCIVVLEDENDNHYLGLSGCGMDLSDQLACAYMVIDLNIPDDLQVDKSRMYSLPKEAAENLIASFNK